MKVELLAPAGDFEKVKIAFMYGASAVYLGGNKFGLRAGATLDNDYIKKAVNLANSLGKKIYVTVNIFARNHDFKELIKYLKYLESIGVHAVIVSDLGVMKIVREHTGLEIHISTQANVLNKHTAEEYVRLGAKRIILGRELTLPEIKEIADYLKGKCDVEVFVHGAMCVSYSGRCLLSNYMINRDANRGECAHPCRWKYALMEEKRPGEYFPIDQDQNGSYIMNSRDLVLIEHLRDLERAGVKSFKIEGRMKSEYYVASVVNAYRRAMDGEAFDYMTELNKTAHRPWTTGFLLPDGETLYYDHNNPVTTHEVVAMCLGGARVKLKNAFEVGDTLEILSPHGNFNKTFQVTAIKEVASQTSCHRANKADEIYEIECPYELREGEFLRKKKP